MHQPYVLALSTALSLTAALPQGSPTVSIDVGLANCYSDLGPSGHPDLDSEACYFAIATAEKELKGYNRQTWRSPLAGTVLSWPDATKKCAVNLGLDVPKNKKVDEVFGDFDGAQAIDSIEYIKSTCQKGAKGYLPYTANSGWYIEVTAKDVDDSVREAKANAGAKAKMGKDPKAKNEAQAKANPMTPPNARVQANADKNAKDHGAESVHFE